MHQQHEAEEPGILTNSLKLRYATCVHLLSLPLKWFSYISEAISHFLRLRAVRHAIQNLCRGVSAIR